MSLSALAFLRHVPAARWPAACSILARIPTGAVGLVLPLIAITDPELGIGIGGVAFACCRVANAVSGPAWGRMVDRAGIQRVVLGLTCAFVTVALMLAAAPMNVPVFLLGSVGLGIFIAPIPAIMRSLWNRQLPDQSDRDAANAWESVLSELILISARLLIAVVSLLVSLQWVMVVLAALSLIGGIGLVCTPLVRGDSGTQLGAGRRTLRGLMAGRTLFTIFTLASASLGAFSIGLIEGAHRSSSGATLASLAVGAWALGSVVGVQLGRLDRVAQTTRGLSILLATMGFLQLFTIAASGFGPAALLVSAFVAGLPIAAIISGLYRVLPTITPPGQETEFFAWAFTAILIGDGAGAVVAGFVVDLASVAVIVTAVIPTALAALAVRISLGEHDRDRPRMEPRVST